ncbi:MAG: sugar ABC transporter permease [Rhodobacteraceae bacterium]|nr:sugar ABC transporter permease [Paracoccaceae bacterium]
MTASADAPGGARKKSILETLELDTRLLGMLVAFVALTIGFHLFTGGLFLTPRNIFNLTIQTVSVAIMATGMVFVIVLRDIDLSVGSLLCLCSAVMGLLQVQLLPDIGIPLGSPLIAPIAIVAGLIVGGIVGAFNGWVVGYLSVPSFIVTLGGLLVWRNVAWYITSGQTLGPLDERFQLFGGINGTLGAPLSWAFGLIACVATIFGMLRTRQGRIKHEFPVKPMWAEATIAAIAIVVILGFVWTLNSYDIPTLVLQRRFAAIGKTMPDGYTDVYGLPISVFLLIAVAIAMTLVASKTRFGRYIFATGGNPSAAELSGINTKMLTVKVFAVMGMLAGLSAVVASARQTYHTNDIGTLDELRTIAAAVIGGTALSGGVGTIYGAILGALIMQSLQSGMAMVGVDSPFQNIVVGAVLVLAVFVDTLYRKRTGALK